MQLMPADVILDPGDGLTSKIGTEASSRHVTGLISYLPLRSSAFSVPLLIIISSTITITNTNTTYPWWIQPWQISINYQPYATPPEKSTMYS